MGNVDTSRLLDPRFLDLDGDAGEPAKPELFPDCHGIVTPPRFDPVCRSDYDEVLSIPPNL